MSPVLANCPSATCCDASRVTPAQRNLVRFYCFCDFERRYDLKASITSSPPPGVLDSRKRLCSTSAKKETAPSAYCKSHLILHVLDTCTNIASYVSFSLARGTTQSITIPLGALTRTHGHAEGYRELNAVSFGLLGY